MSNESLKKNRIAAIESNRNNAQEKYDKITKLKYDTLDNMIKAYKLFIEYRREGYYLFESDTKMTE